MHQGPWTTCTSSCADPTAEKHLVKHMGQDTKEYIESRASKQTAALLRFEPKVSEIKGGSGIYNLSCHGFTYKGSPL